MTDNYTPKSLVRWTLPDSYYGATWEGYYSAGIGRNRDSDALARSNFAVASKALLAISDRVEIIRENHWACGWVEWIAIPGDDFVALEAADAMQAQLEDYPALDADHWSEVEHEDAGEVWANCYDARARVAYIREHRDQFEFRSLADLLGCARGQYFAGYASELIG